MTRLHGRYACVRYAERQWSEAPDGMHKSSNCTSPLLGLRGDDVRRGHASTWLVLRCAPKRAARPQPMAASQGHTRRSLR